MWPLGSASTRCPAAERRVGTMTTTSSPRTTTPPALTSVDVALECGGVMDGELATPLGDDAGALEHREEAAGRLAAGPGQLCELGLRRGDEDVLVGAALGLLLVDE